MYLLCLCRCPKICLYILSISKICFIRSDDLSYTFFCFVRSKSIGDAIQTEEYVPTIVPNIRARVNHLSDSGPKKNIATSTIKTVNDVKRDRRIVSWIERSIRGERPSFLFVLSCRLDLIRSRTTIVSFIE
jgi:hypothetical protein